MKSFTILLLLAIAAILSGCAAGMIDTSKRISSDLQSTGFNSIASRYMDRPTFVSFAIMKDGSRVLNIMIDSYGTNQPTVPLYEKNKTEYISAIDKYLEWESKARSNKDSFDKEILRVSNPNTLIVQFSFHSGNEFNHYLGVGFLSKGLLGEIPVPILTFDRKNALELKRLLQNLTAVDASPVADQYN